MEQQDLHHSLLAEFERFEKSLNGATKSPIHKLRREAAERFRELGFPTIRHEEWKYTNIMPLIKHNYSALKDNKPPVEPLANTPDFIPKNSVKILLINGLFSPDYSLPDGLPQGATAALINDADPKFMDFFGKLLDFSGDAFAALNTAFTRGGVHIHIAENANISRPIAVLNYTDARSEETLAQPRLIISAGRNSQAIIIEHHIATGEFPALINSASEIYLDENANLCHYIIQDGKEEAIIAASRVRQSSYSRYESVTLTLGGKFVRNNVGTCLAGPNAEAHFYGLALGYEKNLTDNRTIIDHEAPNCYSSEIYKHILDDRSTAVFNGKIYARKGAQKTNAYQSNRTILLSNGATINSKPQLEIFADDVKCSHGATSGYLDDEALFYLRSRGISEDKAKALLLHAFAGEILDKIQIEETRESLDAIIASRLCDAD